MFGCFLNHWKLICAWLSFFFYSKHIHWASKLWWWNYNNTKVLFPIDSVNFVMLYVYKRPYLWLLCIWTHEKKMKFTNSLNERICKFESFINCYWSYASSNDVKNKIYVNKTSILISFGIDSKISLSITMQKESGLFSTNMMLMKKHDNDDDELDFIIRLYFTNTQLQLLKRLFREHYYYQQSRPPYNPKSLTSLSLEAASAAAPNETIFDINIFQFYKMLEPHLSSMNNTYSNLALSLPEHHFLWNN